MNTSKIEIAFTRHICDVCGHFHLFTIFPYSCRCVRIVYSCQNHGDILGRFEVKRQENPIDVLDLAVLDAVKNFRVQAGARADDKDLSVSVEEVQNASGSDLANKVNQPARYVRMAGLVDGLWRTSPPPTTRTFLPLICHARIREPPPWTSGNPSNMVGARE